MKIRNGFVSNSSSCSFTINLSDLTEEQIEKIKNHSKIDPYFKNEGYGYAICDEWEIDIRDGYLLGFTFMDNFDIGSFLTDIGVDPLKVNFDGDNY